MKPISIVLLIFLLVGLLAGGVYVFFSYPREKYYHSLVKEKLAQISPNLEASKLHEAINEAIDATQEATQRFPRSIASWLGRARVYRALYSLGIEGSEQEVAASYAAASALEPDNPLVYFEQAVFKELAVGKLAAAQYLDSVVSGSSDRPELWFKLGVLRYELGEYEQAEEALGVALELDPAFANARYFLALSLDRLGRTEEALKEFKAVATFNPDHPGLQNIINNLQANLPALAH